jgi:hypothetical protein
MNKEKGGPLASMIGEVERMDVDEKGHAWGEFLRVRISVDVSEPFMRCVVVESPFLKKTIYYEVKYEKMPMYCISCYLLGHSSIMCPTPASRGEDRLLPWNSDRLLVPEVKWRDQKSSSRNGVQSG